MAASQKKVLSVLITQRGTASSQNSPELMFDSVSIPFNSVNQRTSQGKKQVRVGTRSQ